MPNVNLEIASIPSRLRTGDLVLVSVREALTALGTRFLFLSFFLVLSSISCLSIYLTYSIFFFFSLITGSKWNHVAMVVGFQGSMFFLEALGDVGVQLNRFFLFFFFFLSFFLFISNLSSFSSLI